MRPPVNPEEMRKVFDLLTEMQTNPGSKRAQKFAQLIEEEERKNPRKRKSQILIKTMRKGKQYTEQRPATGMFP